MGRGCLLVGKLMSRVNGGVDAEAFEAPRHGDHQEHGLYSFRLAFAINEVELSALRMRPWGHNEHCAVGAQMVAVEELVELAKGGAMAFGFAVFAASVGSFVLDRLFAKGAGD